MPATSEFRYDGAVRTVNGAALTGVSIAVLSQPAVTTTQPGSPLVSIFAAALTNSAALSSASWLNGVVTFVFTAPPPADVVVGSYIQITGVTPTGYNGVWLVTSVSGNNVTAALTTNPGAYVAGGTVATSALPNPFLSDNLGNFFFYAPAGTYTIQIYDATLGRITTQLVFPDQPIIAGGAGAGSVTSVGLTTPAEFIVTGSPVIGAGTLAITKANQNANQIYAGPTGGGPAVPAFRSLVTADMPAGNGTVTSVGLTLTVPAFLSSVIAGSPVTTNGTLAATVTLVNQNANLVFAGPNSGGPATPGFRALATADVPFAPNITNETDLTIQSAAIGSTVLFAVPAGGAGKYRVSWAAKVTTIGTVSSTLGGAAGFQVIYTDNDDSVVVTTPAWWGGGNNGAAPTSAALNTTQVQESGEIVVNAKAATNISFTFGYTAAAGATMVFSIHITTEKI